MSPRHRHLLICLLGTALLQPACKPRATASQPSRQAKGLGFALSYDPALFSACTVRQDPRLTQQEIGEDIPDGLGPARVRFAFKAVPAATLREHADPTYALDGQITVIPLNDTSVPDYAAAYPTLLESAADLQKVLATRPTTFPTGLSTPDLNGADAVQSLHAQLAYLDTPWCSGVFFLTRYEQDSGAIQGDDLSAVFQGLSKDGRYYVTADLPVGHRALLKLPAPDGQEIEAHYEAYLRRIEATLNGAQEDTFSPSLAKLKAMIQSLHPQP